MSRWTRAPGEYLVKYRRFTDGELLHVLTGRPEGGISDFDRSVYAALQTVKAAAIRWFVWAASFSALGILSHFKALRTASGAGLQLIHREPDKSAGEASEGFFYVFRKAPAK